jgi:alanyl-tRNA synthetase
VSETAGAAGVRRLEAITGAEAVGRFQAAERRLATLAEQLKTTPAELPVRIGKLLERQKELEREVSRLTAKLSLADLDGMIASARMIDTIRVVSAAIPLDSPKTLREVGDRVRDRLGSGVAVLGGELQGKVALLVIVSKDLTDRLQAGNIIKKISALVGGSGGGRADMAQAGGPMVDKLPAALDKVYDIVSEYLGGGT